LGRFPERKDILLDKIPEEVLSSCREYSKKNKKEECCGIIVNNNNKLIFKPCNNISNDRKSFFMIDPYEIIDNNVEYIFHSHCLAGPRPSSSDIKSSIELCIPFLIYSVLSDSFYLYDNIGV
jgi:proteasome lid subunit RPN8/RPN11